MSNAEYKKYSGKVKNTKLQGLSKYHNHIKQMLYFKYSNKAKKHLDIGSGVGGDIYKYINAGISQVIALQPSENSIIDKGGFLDRCGEKCKNGEIISINGVGDLKFDTGEAGLTKEAKDKLIEIFSKKEQFDSIGCQFSFHYLLDTTEKINNTIYNIVSNLKKGGYFYITLFNGTRVMKLINDKHSCLFSKETKELFNLEFNKKELLYDNTIINYGKITVFFSEYRGLNKGITENLVNIESLIEILSKFGLKLINQKSFIEYYLGNKEKNENVYNLSNTEKCITSLYDFIVFQKI